MFSCMKPIAFIDGYTRVDGSNAGSDFDRIFIDVGEHDSVARLEAPVGIAMETLALKQFAHSVMLKFLNDDARHQAIMDGLIIIADEHTDTQLKAELTKSSIVSNSVCETSRSHWILAQPY